MVFFYFNCFGHDVIACNYSVWDLDRMVPDGPAAIALAFFASGKSAPVGASNERSQGNLRRSTSTSYGYDSMQEQICLIAEVLGLIVREALV